MPVISDSQGNSYGLLSANWLLFALVTTAIKDGANIITVQNARAICVVELGNLVAACAGSFSGIGFAASINTSTNHIPARALWAMVTLRNASLPMDSQGVLTSMLDGKCVVGSSALSVPGSYTMTVPINSVYRRGEEWQMVQVVKRNIICKCRLFSQN
jgi:hypothetical protein